MRKIFTLLLMLAAATGALFADDYTNVGDIEYYVYVATKTARVVEYNGGAADEVIIPSTIDYTYTMWDNVLKKNVAKTITCTVTSIDGAFDDRTNITSIIVPNIVTTIGSGAFTNVPNVMYSGNATGAPWGARCINGTVEGWLVFADETKTQLVACNSSATEIVIPNSVVGIGYNVFYDCDNITSVAIHSNEFLNCHRRMNDIFEDSHVTNYILGDEITSIGNEAFYGCSRLTSIIIPNSVVSIGSEAFYGCSSLDTVIIGSSVVSIGSKAFYGCSRLTSIIIPNSVVSIGSEAFYECSRLVSATIGNGITSLEEDSFAGCSSLTSVIIGDGVTYIAYGAFRGCNSLKSVVIPNSVNTIGAHAFSCDSLESVIMGTNVDHISRGAFRSCNKLVSVTFLNGVTCIEEFAFPDGGIDTLNYYITEESRNFRNIHLKITEGYKYNNGRVINIIPGSTYIQKGLFANNSIVEKVTIPANIALVPDSCFMGCTNLQEVKIGLMEAEGEEVPDSSATHNAPRKIKTDDELDKIVTETRVGKSVFNGCSSLTSIKFARGVQTIDDAACKGLINLTTISFANTVKNIGEEAFEGCGLTNLIIPSTLESIGYKAFANNIYLTSVNMQCPLDACVTGNGINLRRTFEGSNNITELSVLSTGSTEPGDQAWCRSVPEIFPSLGNLTTINFLKGSTQVHMGGDYPYLANVRLSRGIKIIREGSFSKCPNLKSIELPDELEYIAGNAFSECGLTSIDIPDKVTTIFDHAFTNCTHLTKVILSQNCQTIGNDAFNGCTAIKNIVAKSNVAPHCINEGVFGGLSPRGNILQIPYGEEVKNSYMNERVWPSFLREGYATFYLNTIPLQTAEAIAEPQATQASLSFPQENNAVQYNIALSDGVDYNINFPLSPEMAYYNGQANLPARIKTEGDIQGFKFGITGLTPLTTYNYAITANDENNEVLVEYTGMFTTLAEEETAIENVQGNEVQYTKVLRNGQIFILRGEKVYTLTGQEVK